jgi:hypothetical protein
MIVPRRTRTILAVIASWTTAPVWSTSATGPLSRLSANPGYFTDGSGKAIYLTGSHTWANLATDQGSTYAPAPFDYQQFLDFLIAHNHDLFRDCVWDLPFPVQGHNGGGLSTGTRLPGSEPALAKPRTASPGST